MTDVTARLEASRKELLDLGLRNPMISFSSQNRLDVVDEVALEVFRILVEQQKAMTFQPIPDRILENDDLFTEADEIDWHAAYADSDPGNSRHTDSKLQTGLDAEALTRRLIRIEGDARTFIEEQGVNVLYLALGFIHWFEDTNSTRERRAPLFLLPVRLTRTSVRENFQLSYTGEEFGYNLSFSERLKAEFGFPLPELDVAEYVDLAAYYQAVTELISQPRWRVEPDEIALSFFSFGKFLMYRDLDPRTWPQDAGPGAHPILRALLGEGFREQGAPLLPEDTNVDAVPATDQLHQVVDADSSQTLAILDISSGRNLVVQGPPGTGKSQTITNVIAEAVGKGKRVLFVSEKMAALEVVKRRLDAVHLGVAVLELHSHKSNKRAVLEELKRTLELARPRDENTADDVELTKRIRDSLNAYCEAANTPVLNTRLTPVDLFGRIAGLGPDAARLARFDFAPMRAWTDGEFKARLFLVERLAERLQVSGAPIRNPFWGSRLVTLLPADIDHVRGLLDDLRSACQALHTEAEMLARRLHLPAPQRVAEVVPLCRAALRAVDAPHVRGIALTSTDWQARRDDVTRLIEVGERVAALRLARAGQVIEDAWRQDLLAERQHFAAHGGKWYRALIGDYRRSRARLQGLASAPLPKAPQDCLALIDDILEVRRASETYRELEPVGRTLFAAQWQGERSDWVVLRQITEWVVDTYRKVGDGSLPKGILQFLEGSPSLDGLARNAAALLDGIKRLREQWTQVQTLLQLGPVDAAADGTPADASTAGLGLPFAAQLNLLDRWLEAYPGSLLDLTRYNAVAEELQANGLGFLLEAAARWELPAVDLPRAVTATWYQGLINHAFRERVALARFDPLVHEREITRFRDLDQRLFRHHQIRLVQQHWKTLPNSTAGGEVAVLNRQFNLKRNHLPIRKLIEQAGRAIQALKPVFMMSPMSIATFLPRGGLDFDLVVFDEASQVKPVDAFGAILRGQQTVVVGDSRQLPPTNFFAAALDLDTDDDADQTTADLESVLGLFLAQGAPQRMLRWHYRSRHESLIALSNQEFYESKLVVFPSPGANPAAQGLVFNYLPHTTYDRGGSRANKDEAEAVAAAVMRHARETPHLTLGVAAFSVQQRDAIAFAVERLRRADPSCEPFFQAHPIEPFFVKNLENVQGDERDVILISIGYGKTAEGYLAHNFGPLNADGGERRLNVLITRARLACQVFANFTADDIDLARTQARGVVALKRYLAYAKDGTLDSPLGTLGDIESPFEMEVAKALTGLGFDVVTQVGCAGFRIDLGIKDPERPGRYLLGIECDGATYHSSRSARDRDRLRQQVLEGLGWRIHRIWSTDWFRNQDVPVSKAHEAILKAIDHWRAVDRGEHVAAERPARPAEPGAIAREEVPEAVISATRAVPYRKAEIVIHLGDKALHELDAGRMATYVRQVVEVEAPVHRDVVIARITAAAGVGRAGSRIREAIERGTERAKRDGVVTEKKEYLSLVGGPEVQVRDRSGLEAAERKTEWVSDEEIEAALLRVVAEAFSISVEEAGVKAMAMMGFQRRTKELQARFGEILAALVEGKILEEGANGWIQECAF